MSCLFCKIIAGEIPASKVYEDDRMIAWINPPYLPYAPALAQMGIALDRCMVVRPANKEDALWATEQALRSGACGAVLFWLAQDEYAWLRRFQMAAEAGRSMAVYYRSSAAERLSTPAHLRVVLEPCADALRIRIPKRRGPPLLAPVCLHVSASPAGEGRGPFIPTLVASERPKAVA